MFKNATTSLAYLFFLSLFFLSCEKDEALMVSPVPEPEPEEASTNTVFPGAEEALWPYFRRFEEEAALRGLAIDLVASGVTGTIAEIDEDNVLGQCNYNSHLPEKVTIDQAFWARASDRAREFVVFHELGHCELLRDHFEGAFANGSCISIMRSGLEGCRDNYNATTRTRYLNELFDPEKAGDWIQSP